jgi:hypothetical protein
MGGNQKPCVVPTRENGTGGENITKKNVDDGDTCTPSLSNKSCASGADRRGTGEDGNNEAKNVGIPALGPTEQRLSNCVRPRLAQPSHRPPGPHPAPRDTATSSSRCRLEERL